MLVPARTESTVNRTHVTLRELNDTVTAEPSLFNAPTGTDEPSENVNVPDVTWSLRFGRSYNTTRSNVTADDHVNWIHAPAPCRAVTHSLE